MLLIFGVPTKLEGASGAFGVGGVAANVVTVTDAAFPAGVEPAALTLTSKVYCVDGDKLEKVWGEVASDQLPEPCLTS